MVLQAIPADCQPPLKWAGGKRWLLSTIRPLWSPYADRRLVEPFAGGLAIALGLQPAAAWLNDVNPHLINFYQHLQRGLRLNIDSDFTPEVYYARRTEFNNLALEERFRESDAKRRKAAMLFYYLNRHCYNGICRFNSKGGFNTPIGRFVNPRYEKDLSRYAQLLADWKFTEGDFEAMKPDIQPKDFVYADPPYDEAYNGYSRGGFSLDDQERLAKMLSAHRGPVVISNNATERMLSLYDKHRFDTTVQVMAPRMIKYHGKPKRVMEVLATRHL